MPKATVVRDWKCQECGKRMTLKQAERASMSVQGCPKCGGADIDLDESYTYPPVVGYSVAQDYTR